MVQSKGLLSLPIMKQAAEKREKAITEQDEELLAELAELDGMEHENLAMSRRKFV